MSSPSPIRREVGSIALLFTGLSSIIGSGWLFGAWRTAGLAGSYAVWAWLLGAAIMITIALTFAELAAALPRSGGIYVYLNEGLGPRFAFTFGWTGLGYRWDVEKVLAR